MRGYLNFIVLNNNIIRKPVDILKKIKNRGFLNIVKRLSLNKIIIKISNTKIRTTKKEIKRVNNQMKEASIN